MGSQVEALSASALEELGAAMPVRVSGLVGSRRLDANVTSGVDSEPVVPAPFASIECGSAPGAGGLVAKPPHAVRIRALEIRNATRATGGGLFASGAGANVEVTDTVFRACAAGGASQLVQVDRRRRRPP